MRVSYLITVLLISACGSQESESDIPIFHVTANCIENILISMNEEDDDDWALELEFSTEGLEKIRKLNSSYSGKIINIVFEHEEYGFQTVARVQKQIISNMQVDGIKSEMEAQSVKQSIIESKGACGIAGA